MSDSAMVILPCEISNSELGEFVESLGGSLVPEEQANFVISDGAASVWLGIQPRIMTTGLYDVETLNDWEKALGEKPRSIIELQLGHSGLCYQLYVYIVYRMGKKWQLILDDIDDSIVTYSEVVDKYQAVNKELTIDKPR